MENKTAGEILDSRIWTGSIRTAVIKAMEEHASLQCAEMKNSIGVVANLLNDKLFELDGKQKQIAYLRNLLHMANQMLITYEMRHPEDDNCLVGRSNAEAKELIENALNPPHDTINKP